MGDADVIRDVGQLLAVDNCPVLHKGLAPPGLHTFKYHPAKGPIIVLSNPLPPQITKTPSLGGGAVPLRTTALNILHLTPISH